MRKDKKQTPVVTSVNEQTKKELEETKRRYEDLFELAPDAIVILDETGVITSYNAATTILSGYSKEELVDKHFSKLGVLKPKDIPKYLKLFLSIMGCKISPPVEVGFTRKDETPAFIEAHIGLIKKDGEIRGVQVIARDITQRKQMQ